ncbi:hypothetical protein [Pontibacter sp. G13]|uniref:hypothetical protein n=1 Tax=Pontibacter sp. G13 TaxID=3074898 RepID=UPI00288AF6D7|nr:hypothetical protein [Pontibacter sp. G13]WNJ16911.1 hypothetical protein RJD25_18785 [Pontibacter sp. G13]
MRPFTLTARTLFACMMVAILSSCEDRQTSDLVLQDRIFTQYELSFDPGLDQTTAVAKFSIGSASGDGLELGGNSEITFNGSLLTLGTDPITSEPIYETTFDGLISGGTFLFQDTEGNQYSNTVSMKSVDFIQTPSNINRSEDLTIEWTGGELGASEEMTVDFLLAGSSVSNNPTFVTDEIGATSITISSSDLLSLDPDTYTMSLDRWARPTPTETPAAGGAILLHYQAEPLVVDLD